MTQPQEQNPPTPAGAAPRGMCAPLLAYARPYRRGWAGMLGLMLAGSVVGLAGPWPMQVLADHVLGNRPMGPWLAWASGVLPGAGDKVGLLGWAASAGLALLAVGCVIERLLNMGWVRLGQGMVYDLAGDLLARLQRRSVLYHARAGVGDTMSRVIGDSWCVYELVETVVLGPARALVALALTAAIMAAMDPWLTAWSVAVAPLMAAGVVLLGKRVRATAQSKREVETQLHSHVQQTLAGLPAVQAYGREGHEHGRYVALTTAAVRAQRRWIVATNVSALATGMVTTLGAGLVLWLGARRVAGGALTVGGLLVFVAYLAALQVHLLALARAYTSVQSLRARAGRVLEVLDAEPEIRERAGARPLGVGEGGLGLAFEDVSFGYEAGRAVLRGVSFGVAPGEVVALVGASGAGKSTLAALAARLLDPWEGRVTLGGQDLRELRLADVRRGVALVLQEPFLFAGTVRENIAYGRADATDAEVREAARLAGADGFVSALPGGYDAVLGERGCTLSGGQRQRLTVARAVLTGAPVIVLDEPTSALDGEAEAVVMESVRRLAAGEGGAPPRACLVIAHRLSTIERADRAVVLDAGRVVEQGTHGELLAAGGVYGAMWSGQVCPPFSPLPTIPLGAGAGCDDAGGGDGSGALQGRRMPAGVASA